MKFSRVQRLFVAIGHVDKEIIRYSCMLKEKPWRQLQTNHPAYNFKKRYLKGLRARRKRLIREALWAYEEELIKAYYAGVDSVRKEPDERPIIIEEDGQSIIF